MYLKPINYQINAVPCPNTAIAVASTASLPIPVSAERCFVSNEQKQPTPHSRASC